MGLRNLFSKKSSANTSKNSSKTSLTSLNEFLHNRNNANFINPGSTVFGSIPFTDKVFALQSDFSWEENDPDEIVITGGIDHCIVDGNAHTIDGKNQKISVFHVKDAVVTLRNINFKNLGGHAIVIMDDNVSSKVIIENCTFENTGGIFNFGRGDKVLIKDCNFIDNRQSIVHSYGSIKVLNSRFSNSQENELIDNSDIKIEVVDCRFNSF